VRILSAILGLLVVVGPTHASILIYNHPDDLDGKLAVEIENEPCLPVNGESFARSFSFSGALRLPKKTRVPHYHALTIDCVSHRVDVWDVEQDGRYRNGTPPDLRVISVWGTLPRLNGFGVELELYMTNPPPERPEPKAIHTAVPVGFASLAYFRPETGCLKNTDCRFSQVTLWSSPENGHTYKTTSKGYSRAGQPDTADDWLRLPLLAEKLGLDGRLIWVSGPPKTFSHILVRGYRIK
jgi:hypothetical protein